MQPEWTDGAISTLKIFKHRLDPTYPEYNSLVHWNNHTFHGSLNCTAMLWNFTSEVQWLRIPCSTTMELPLLICQRQLQPDSAHPELNKRGIVYIMGNSERQNLNYALSLHESCVDGIDVSRSSLYKMYYHCRSKVIKKLVKENMNIQLYEFMRNVCKVTESVLKCYNDIWAGTNPRSDQYLYIPICMNVIEKNNSEINDFHQEASRSFISNINSTLQTSKQHCATHWVGAFGCCYRFQSPGPSEDMDIAINATCGKTQLDLLTSIFQRVEHLIVTDPIMTSTIQCKPGQFTCENGECVYLWMVSDGVSDCTDLSDELQSYTNSKVSKNNYYVYPNSTCYPQYQCEDEEGGCVVWHHVCDGKYDCPSGSDESTCVIISGPYDARLDVPLTGSNTVGDCGGEKYYKCELSDACIEESQVGDGLPDCPLWQVMSEENYGIAYPVVPWIYTAEDEDIRSNNTLSQSCPVGSIPCPYGPPYSCIRLDQLCVYAVDYLGRLNFCTSGGHLTDCYHFDCSGMYKCATSYCLSLPLVCDGITDCPLGDDESGCVSSNLTCPGFLKCKGGQCVHLTHVCDGKYDCPLVGEDELHCDRKQCPENCICTAASIVCIKASIKIFNALSYKAIMIHQNNRIFPYISNGTEVVVFELTNSILSIVSANLFAKMPNTASINLQDNNITSIHNYAFTGLCNLRQLNLQGNSLSVINKYAFHGLSNLRAIALSYCQLMSLRFEVRLGSVKSLSFTNCIITDFSLNMSSFPKLRILKLGSLKVSYMSVIKSETVNNLTVIGNNSFVCCLFPSKNCSVPHNLTCLCVVDIDQRYMIPIWVFGPLLLILSFTSCLVALLTSGGTLKFSGIAPFSKSIGDVSMGVYLILVGLKDQLFFNHLVSEILYSKHILCVAAGLLQYYAIIVTYCMDTVHLYSLHLIIKNWSMDKSKVKSLVRWLCVVISFHIPALFVLMNMIEYWAYGSYMDFGHACSLIVANQLSINGKVFLGHICITFLAKQCLDYTFIKSICKELDASSDQVQLPDAARLGREKSKRNLKLECIVNALAYLPILICIACAMFTVNFSTLTSLNLAYSLPVHAWVSVLRTIWKGWRDMMKHYE